MPKDQPSRNEKAQDPLRPTRQLAEEVRRSLVPHQEAMTRLMDSVGPIRSLADRLTEVMRSQQELLKGVRLPELPTFELSKQMSEALSAQQQSVARLSASLAPAHGIAVQVAKAMAAQQSLLKDLNISASPLAGILESINRSFRPLFDSGWIDALEKSFKRFDDALTNAESMGRSGWTVPLNADLSECIRLLREATTPETADAAFAEFYGKEGGAHLAELVAGLLHRRDLTEWQPLLEEVVFALDAGKYRVAVPALLSTFEGVARRIWTSQFDNGPGRSAFFDRKLKGLEPGSYDYLMWRGMRAFVFELYVQARENKPPMLNRHWILHGREPAAGNLVDCLRLLQAIHTALSLAEHEREDRSDVRV